MQPLSRLLIPVCAAGLIACGSENEPGDGDRSNPAGTPNAPTARAQAGIDWASYPVTLFSESLHDIPMPRPGRARVEIFGGVHEAELLADCSAPTDPPPVVNDWDDHRISASFSIHMDERYSNISVIRAVKHEIDGQPRSGPVEVESVAIRTLTRGGQTLDLRNYALRRNRPDQPPRTTRAHDERPAPPASIDEVPGVRVHPDGRRFTYVGQIGRSEAFEGSDYQDFEDIRIAIHCGPV